MRDALIMFVRLLTLDQIAEEEKKKNKSNKLRIV